MSVELIIISACSEEGFSWLFVSIDHAIVFQGELKESEIKETRDSFSKGLLLKFPNIFKQ